MKKTTYLAIVLGLLFTATALWGTPASMTFSTYYGGLEDQSGKSSDYDYNDLVFSLKGTGLTLQSSMGRWNSRPNVNSNGSPFWDNSSLDGSKYNVGYCIYGGGNCGSGLAPDAYYLAKQSGGAAKDVYFSVKGNVAENVYFQIASLNDVVGWYLVSDPKRSVHWINSTQSSGTFSFNPGGDFGLVANTNHGKGGDTYYSQSKYSSTDNSTSHFAWFGSKTSNPAPTPTPEPGTFVLLGSGLAGVIGLVRKKLRR